MITLGHETLHNFNESLHHSNVFKMNCNIMIELPDVLNNFYKKKYQAEIQHGISLTHRLQNAS